MTADYTEFSTGHFALDVFLEGGYLNNSLINQSNFIAESIAIAATDNTLPNIAVPNGFALFITANVANTGYVYIRTDATVSAARNTLGSGDTRILYITNANLVHYAGSHVGDYIDILVEQV